MIEAKNWIYKIIWTLFGSKIEKTISYSQEIVGYTFSWFRFYLNFTYLIFHKYFVLFYIAAVYKRDIYYSFLMVDRNMFGTKSSSKCNCILSRRITFPWINMLNKMKICKWIMVAVAENGMREVYHCKLFAWFSFALHLKIKQRNSWYERMVYHYYQ